MPFRERSIASLTPQRKQNESKRYTAVIDKSPPVPGSLRHTVFGFLYNDDDDTFDTSTPFCTPLSLTLSLVLFLNTTASTVVPLAIAPSPRVSSLATCVGKLVLGTYIAKGAKWMHYTLLQSFVCVVLVLWPHDIIYAVHEACAAVAWPAVWWRLRDQSSGLWMACMSMRLGSTVGSLLFYSCNWPVTSWLWGAAYVLLWSAALLYRFVPHQSTNYSKNILRQFTSPTLWILACAHAGSCWIRAAERSGIVLRYIQGLGLSDIYAQALGTGTACGLLVGGLWFWTGRPVRVVQYMYALAVLSCFLLSWTKAPWYFSVLALGGLGAGTAVPFYTIPTLSKSVYVAYLDGLGYGLASYVQADWYLVGLALIVCGVIMVEYVDHWERSQKLKDEERHGVLETSVL